MTTCTGLGSRENRGDNSTNNKSTSVKVCMIVLSSYIRSHFKLIKRCYSQIRYMLLHVDEKFIFDNVHKISLAYMKIVCTKGSMQSHAKDNLAWAKREQRRMEKRKCHNKFNDDKIQSGVEASLTKDTRVHVHDEKSLWRIRNQKKTFEVLCHEDDIGDLDSFIPHSLLDITPDLLRLLLGKVTPYSILALPTIQVLFFVLAPFWFLLAVFIIPPVLISYLILTIVCSFVQTNYVQDFDVDTHIRGEPRYH